MHLFQDYAALPDRFHAPLSSAGHRESCNDHLAALNEPLARFLTLDPAWLRQPEGRACLARGTRPDGCAPVAMAYAGHQFGHFVPSLGDGRAVLVGECQAVDGRLYDLHLKGWGPTPFSRRGDGRAALGPILREMLVSEAMAALGVPTTRSLAVTLTGETVLRERNLPGAVLARVARSHVRIGTFQYFLARQDSEALRILVDHTILRLYPEHAHRSDRALALLEAVVTAQARLVAQWLHLGFIHGVMNTDNMSIAGETIDYGPCAFLDVYDPDACFSAIDQNGRYAYRCQPDIALWNLERLADCLLPLIDPDETRAIAQAREALKTFDPVFGEAYREGWRRKLGFMTERPADMTLIADLLGHMQRQGADFTLTFRTLNQCALTHDGTALAPLFREPARIRAWHDAWQARLTEDAVSEDERFMTMQRTNPRLIPRNHRIEQALNAAYDGNFQPFHALQAALSAPYAEGSDGFDTPPRPEERIVRTFCGT